MTGLSTGEMITGYTILTGIRLMGKDVRTGNPIPSLKEWFSEAIEITRALTLVIVLPILLYYAITHWLF